MQNTMEALVNVAHYLDVAECGSVGTKSNALIVVNYIMERPIFLTKLIMYNLQTKQVRVIFNTQRGAAVISRFQL